ncbi:flagellar hook assembly protein FlgD [Proteocatella sphenisci]|uniref:flagellar hook assembly protein FlgD n=1 Tax=Proteocatella sphenisci TaxID=181070 RepID=UPI0004B0FE07|nr:flagellar hook capping FlgD N-terminal domain-containing protein [Proteocatella sphenisci]
MADIGAVGAASSQVQQSKSNTKTTLDMDDFLKLIVKQLQNQDMMNPMDDAAMMNQMVQMATVNAMSTMADASVTSYAASLVGKEVTVTEPGPDGKIKEISGNVTGTAVYGGKQVIFVNDKTYYLTEIMAVGKLPAKEETKPEPEPEPETIIE